MATIIEGQTACGELLRRHVDVLKVPKQELARAGGVHRQTVYRWLSGRSLPSHSQMSAIIRILRTYDTSMPPRLTDGAAHELMKSAGYNPQYASGVHSRDQIDIAESCTVYSYAYHREAFPPRWNQRIMEVESEVRGTLCAVIDNLPAMARPGEYYLTQPYLARYERDVLQSFVEAHEHRVAMYLQRAGQGEIRHIYGLDSVWSYLEGKTSTWYHSIPLELKLGHLQTTINWLKEGVLDIALTKRPLGAAFEIVGRAVVMVEFRFDPEYLSGENVMGLEIVGPRAVRQFDEQFSSIWSDKDTIHRHTEVLSELRSLLKSVESRIKQRRR